MKCPDCVDGTYVGFNHTEPCRTCGGTMEVPRGETAVFNQRRPQTDECWPESWIVHIEPFDESDSEFLKAMQSPALPFSYFGIPTS